VHEMKIVVSCWLLTLF